MIDWYSLAANSLWIFGLALALATFSYASWQASFYHERTRDRLKRPGTLIVFSVAAVLFCAGLAATSDTTLEIALWSVLGVLFIVQIIALVRQRRAVELDTTEAAEDPQPTE
jgi:lipopolysaccharide export LptBFGC system permease protein LptF